MPEHRGPDPTTLKVTPSANLFHFEQLIELKETSINHLHLADYFSR